MPQLWLRDGSGVARLAKSIYLRDTNGVAQLAKQIWQRDGSGVARLVFSGFTVSPQAASSVGEGGAGQIFWNTDGTISTNDGVTSSWGSPPSPGIGSNYFLKVHFNSGTLAGAGGVALDTWVDLSINRSRSLAMPPNGGRTSFYTYYISNTPSDDGILGSANFTLGAVPA